MLKKFFQNISQTSGGNLVSIQRRFGRISAQSATLHNSKLCVKNVESEHEQLWTRSQSSRAALHPLPRHVESFFFSNDSNQTAGAILWLHISQVDPGRIQPLVDRWWEEHPGQRGRGAEGQGASPRTPPRDCSYFCPWPDSPQGQACSVTRDAGRSVMMAEWRVINQRQ